MKLRITVSLKRVASLVITSALTLSLLPTQFVSAALSSSSLSLQDPRPSTTSQYTMTSTGFNTGQTIGCIELDLGTAVDGTGNPGVTGTPTLVSQSVTASGTWTVDNTVFGSAQKLRATNATPVAPQSGSQNIIWGAVTNGGTAGTTYYGVFTTYTTNACSTPVDTIVATFVYTAGQAVSLSVDPALSFSVAGTSSGASCNSATSNATTTATTIPLGTVTTSTNKIGVQNLTTTTNAGNGYTVYGRYTAKPTSGANTIDDHTGTNASPTTFSSPGTESFGYTTNDATLGTGTAARFTSSGGNKWAAFTTSNAELAYSAASVSNDTICVGQQTGIAGTTEAGTYLNTIIYTATPIY